MLLGEDPIEFYSPPPSAAAKAERGEEFTLWDSDGFSFGDILDAVNPLQHIPVVSTIYRDLSGDDIGHAPRVLGGALFGGAIGAAASLVNVLVDEATGDDIGGHVMAFLLDDGADSGTPAGTTEVAATSHGSSSADVAKPWINPDTRPSIDTLGLALHQAIVPADPVEAPPAPAAPPKPAARAMATPDDAEQRPAPHNPVESHPAPHPPEEKSGAANRSPTARPTDTPPGGLERAAPPETPRLPASAKRSPGAVAAPRAAGAAIPFSARPDAQVPFLPDSMLGALEKYERLMRERNTGPGQVDLSG